MTKTNSKTLLTSLTMAALALPGICVAEEKVANQIPNLESSPFGEITADIQYHHYREDDTKSPGIPAYSLKGYKIDVWQSLFVVPYKNLDFTLHLQRDTQSGASSTGPDVLSVPDQIIDGRSNATINDDRTQVGFTVDYNLSDSKYGGSLYYSSESDHDAKALGLHGQWSFNKNNTVLASSASVSFEKFRPSTSPYPFLPRKGGNKTIQKYYAGVKQDLSRYNYVQFSCEFRYASGFLADTYRGSQIYGDAVTAGFTRNEGVFFPGSELLPYFNYPAGVTIANDSRPGSRSTWTPMLRFVSYLPWTDGSVHFDYRFSDGNWHARSHTFELAYYQPLGDRWQIVPRIRYYSQDRAKFYGAVFNITGGPAPFPTVPLTSNRFSSDHRLAGFGTLGFETKLSYEVYSKLSFGLLGGYYRRDAGYKMGSKDPIKQPFNRGEGALYGSIDLRFKL